MISGENHVLLFLVEPFRCALPVPNVQEIIRMVGISPIPGAAKNLEGTINLRGRMVPVVDLRKRFALPEAPYEARTRILIIGYGGKPLGLIVDDVTDVVEITPDEKSFELSEWAENATAPVAKVIKVDGMAYAVLDLKHLFDNEVLSPLPQTKDQHDDAQSSHSR